MAHVWDVYSIAKQYVQVQNPNSSGTVDLTPNPTYYSSSYTFLSQYGWYQLKSPSKFNGGNYSGGSTYAISQSSTSSPMYYFSRWSATGFHFYGTGGYIYTASQTNVRGGIHSTASNSSSSKYPKNGVSGSYWYIYRGAPSGISYTSSPKAGQSITVSWTEGTTPLYYRLERSTNGGASFETVSATITSTSYTDTSIAASNAPSVMYRVCTLGDRAVSDYSTGQIAIIPRSGIRIKMDGAWKKAVKSYIKENGAWAELTVDTEGSHITNDRKYRLEAIS